MALFLRQYTEKVISMSEKLKHNPSSILNKAFHVDFKGYAPFEVDVFLDEIIQDYKAMENLCKYYEEMIATLKENNQKYQEKLIQLESQLATFKEAPSNSDLLKRLARLESLIDQQD